MDFKSTIEEKKWSIIDKDLRIIDQGDDVGDLNKNCQSDNYFFAIVKSQGSLLTQSRYSSYIFTWWTGTKIPTEKLTKLQDSLPFILQKAMKYIRVENVHHILTKFISETKFYRDIETTRYSDVDYFDRLPKLKNQQWFVFGYNSERQIQSYQGSTIINLQNVFSEQHSNVVLFKRSDEDYFFVVWEGNLTRPIEKCKFQAFISFIYLNFKELHKKMKLVKYTTNDDFPLLANVLKCTSPAIHEHAIVNQTFIYLTPTTHSEVRSRVGKDTPWATLGRGSRSIESTPKRDFTSPLKLEKKPSSSPTTPKFNSPMRLQFSPEVSKIKKTTTSSTTQYDSPTIAPPTPSNNELLPPTNSNSNSNISSPYDTLLPKSVIDDVTYAGYEDIVKKVDLFNSGEINWILIGYSSQHCQSLTLLGTGKGGVNEIKELLKDESTAFGILRVNYTDTRSTDDKEVAVDSNRQKTIFIQWLGRKSRALEKARRNTHIQPVYRMFKQKTLVHGEIEADEFEDLSSSTILQKLTSFRNDIHFKQIIEA